MTGLSKKPPQTHNRTSTILTGSIADLTLAEREELRRFEQERFKQWLDKALTRMISHAEWNIDFAKTLVTKVTDLAAGDDQLTAILNKRLKPERRGKKRGVKPRWTYGRYASLLREYNGLIYYHGMSPGDAKTFLAEVNKFDGVNRQKKLAARLTTARKVVDMSDFPAWALPPNKAIEGGD